MSEIKLRRTAHTQLTGFLTQINNHATAPLTYYGVITIRDRAKEVMQRIEGYQEILIASAADDAAIATQEAAFLPIEATFQGLCNKISYLLQTLPNPASSTGGSAVPVLNVKLPAIELPSFDGNYANWTSFKDLFVATVDKNPQLSKGQKLQYLKSSLQGKPANLIKSMTITDVNYSEAWNLLNERYDNKREIVHSLISTILSYKHLKYESAHDLQALMDCVSESVRSLKVLMCPTDKWDDLLVVIIVSKLDSATRREWAVKQTGPNLPTFDELCKFLSSHIRGLMASGSSNQVSVKKEGSVKVHHVAADPTCKICGKGHHHFQCQDLSSIQPEERSALVKKHRLCFNCLHGDHPVKTCPSKRSCKKCGKRHHTLLHFENNKEGPNKQTGAVGQTSTQQQHQEQVVSNHIATTSHVILKTAVVNARDQHGNIHELRVFIDGGSQGEFISEETVSALRLRRTQSSVNVSGFCNTTVGKSRGTAEVTLVSRFDQTKLIKISAHIMPKLSSILPTARVPLREWPHLRGLQLADPRWNRPGKINVVIGAKLFHRIILQQRKIGADHDPVAYDSIFGWIIAGEASKGGADISSVVSLHVAISPDLDLIRRFWETEEVPQIKILTKEEKQCEDHFKATYSRDKTGRFVVDIPFNGKESNLGLSREAAIRRWISVEKRLQRNQQYHDQYHRFMEEYLELGHMEEVPADQIREVPGKTNYLPHHFVLNEESTTTKLRVVFDGSCKTSSGISLNDTLLVGAKLQEDLYDLLILFRHHAVVLKADIAKMFRQFKLKPSASDYHRIVWRKSPNDLIKDYRLNTITYGTACATNLSTRCLMQLADDVENIYPEAAHAIRNFIFVDDHIGGTNSAEEAITLVQQLNTVMETAGLQLRKWCSNNSDVMASVPEGLREMDPQAFNEESTVKTLGVRWHPVIDEFRFSGFQFQQVEVLTMRILLSNLAKVFDPIGLISCVTLRAKLMYQELWTLALGWDDGVPEHIQQQWKDYAEDLKLLANLKIPRKVTVDGAAKIEIHGFADSSQRALGGIVYLRSISSTGVEVHFVTSKTKVAPLKQISLPRLELEAAHLTAKLVTRVIKSMNLNNCEVFLWSDSTITLMWLASPPRRWSTFVANRVAKTQELIPISSWRHVPGLENPADLASRGVRVEELLIGQKWWKGPDWLSDELLPQYKVPILPKGEYEERKVTVSTNQLTVNTSYLKKFSSLIRLKRATVYMLRFLLYVANLPYATGPVKPDEMDLANRIWLRKTQHQHFEKEISNLKSGKEIPYNSKLKSLHPFLDKFGILRVSGRLDHSSLGEGGRHPIILPGSSHLVYLLVHHHHHQMFHAGFQNIWATLQRQYWIVRGRDRVRHIIRACVVCRRYRAATAKQLMGKLPAERVTPARPFLRVGIDFAGPFILKNPVGRAPKTYKGYLCIFVCIVTKAVSLEPVSALSTSAFLDVLRRFVSRRGLCTDIFSDCGTNFVGADRELRAFFRDKRNNMDIANGLANRSIQWHFSPPSAPHHGGLWEAAVKSAKFHIRRVIGNSYLTFEQFLTILCQIEAVMNSRPLSPLSADPGDYAALTPGHFLIGEPLVAVPERNLEDIPVNRLTLFQQQQQRVQHFWRRWSREYLNTLQQRNKWRWEQENVKVGDLVLIVEDSSPGLWKVGRIQEVHPGDDGQVRVVTVKTATTEMKRSIVKLVPLIKEDN